MATSDIVVSTETGGLGNRLKSWVSSMRLAADARVHWPITRSMPAAFGDLFDNECFVGNVPAGAAVYGSWRLAILPEDEPHLPAGFATAGAGAMPLLRGLGKAWWQLTGRRSDRYRFMVYPKSYSRAGVRADARHIDFEYERIPDALRQTYRPLFGSIIARSDITLRADEWAAGNLTGGFIGVQVRTWRDDARRNRKYHRAAWPRLLRLLDGVEPATRILVVSDSDDVVSVLSRRYGARVTAFPRETKRSESWLSVDGIVEDFIDMLLLARSQRLFASYLSTFSETAWWLGGARARVDVF